MQGLFDPNLIESDPTLYQWVQGMLAKGYQPQQIHFIHMQSMRKQMSMQLQQQQRFQHAKVQMAQNLVHYANSEYNLEQLMAMTYECVHKLYKKEIMSQQAKQKKNSSDSTDTHPSSISNDKEINDEIVANKSNHDSIEKISSNHSSLQPELDDGTFEQVKVSPMNEKKENKDDSSTVSSISSNNQETQKQLEVKNWLTMIGLESEGFYETFVKNGFDSLPLIKIMTSSDLDTMNIHKIGWRKGLLNGIAVLNGNQANDKNIKSKKRKIKHQNEMIEPIRKNFKAN